MARSAAVWNTTLFGRNTPDGVHIADASRHPGLIWYVDSVNGTDAQGYGLAPQSRALKSLKYLVDNAASVGNTSLAAGDEVILAPDHVETLGNEQCDIDTANLYIHAADGCEYDNLPQVHFDHANAEVTLGANGITLERIKFLPSAPDVLIGVEAESGVVGCTLRNCEWLNGEDGAGADEFKEAIHLEAGNHDTQIINNVIRAHAGAGGATHGIYVDAASDRLVIIGNVIYGPYATAGILEDAAGDEHIFVNNSINVSGPSAAFNAASTFAARSGNVIDGSLEDLGETPESTGRARDFYVDSNSGAATGSGLSWGDPLATIDQAINKCTASFGDVIHVAMQHAETIGGAAAIDADVTGITIRGYGVGDQRPLLTFDTNTDTMEINAADVTVENIRFVSAVADLASAIDITGNGDGAVIRGCEFKAGAANLEMLIALDIAADADRLVIEDNVFMTVATGDDTEAIEFAGGSDNTIIRRNIFIGEWDNAVIDAAVAASTSILIADNYIENDDATAGLCINLHAATTGMVVNNKCYGGLTSTDPIVADGCVRIGNTSKTIIGVDVDDELGIRCVRASSTIAQTGQLDKFTIAGGRVLITAIVGEVDTANIGAVASNLKLTYNPTAGTSQDICAATAHANDAIGTLYGVVGDPNVALIKAGTKMQTGLICDVGAIEEDCTANNTGQIQWSVWWKPIDAGATLVAA